MRGHKRFATTISSLISCWGAAIGGIKLERTHSGLNSRLDIREGPQPDSQLRWPEVKSCHAASSVSSILLVQRPFRPIGENNFLSILFRAAGSLTRCRAFNQSLPVGKWSLELCSPRLKYVTSTQSSSWPKS